MILIADTHAGNEGDLDKFFELLTALENTTDDLVFLGDVFDLWIAIERYEHDAHRRFVEWCRVQTKKRDVGFVEGNHEFFVNDYRADAFSWCVSDEKRIDDLTFVHGDTINERDLKYLRFRAMTKSTVMRTIVKYMPFGNAVANFVKRGAKDTNHEFRNAFPEIDVKNYVAACAKKGIKHVFIGHFHGDYRSIAIDGCTIHCVPAWYLAGETVKFDPDTGNVTVTNIR